MGNKFSYTKECSVYPGEYMLMPEVETLLKEVKIPGKDSVAKPLVNIDELKDCFRIEVAVPGVKREDIFIQAHDNVLSIVVLHGNYKPIKKKLKIHEFDSDFLRRTIFLPANADTEFVSAEYRLGMLNMHIPKTLKPSRANNSQIVVY